MKRILAITMLISLAHIAQADVKPPGTYLANQCGQVAAQPNSGFFPIREICIGYFTGEQAEGISIRRGKKAEVYRVIETKLRIENQRLLVLKSETGNVKRQALVESKDGAVVSIKVQEGPVVRTATNFQFMMHTMGAPAPSVPSEEPAQRSAMLNCSGSEIIGNGDAIRRVEVTVSRTATDLKPGIPVKVIVNSKLESNTDKLSNWDEIVNSAGRLNFGDETTVYFNGGMLKVAVGNSGITGERNALDGKLSLSGQADILISCPNEAGL